MPDYAFHEIRGYPGIKGTLEISINENDEVFIGGDPKGLKSLAAVLNWLADVDQEKTNMPEDEREHVHLRPKMSSDDGGELTEFSDETEVCRLDAKGSGKFPDHYYA
ncbi:MAG: hypothetical protein KC944_02510 [Candidatus Omnitrophica bacterium]|nr:hypothetical protein [Candidatus Omnitrophota bacterium]